MCGVSLGFDGCSLGEGYWWTGKKKGEGMMQVKNS